jgi:hypothetical protein
MGEPVLIFLLSVYNEISLVFNFVVLEQNFLLFLRLEKTIVWK